MDVRCKSSDPCKYSDNAFKSVDESEINEACVEISSRISFGDCSSQKKLEKKKGLVLLEGYVEIAATSTEDDQKDDPTRSKSLKDDDLEDLRGYLDLGFGFSYDEIPELNTLPALELCYSMSQKFLDDKHRSPKNSSGEDSLSPPPVTSTPIANWKFSSPGDNPDDVKARLKYWAQAVACIVQLCSLMNQEC